MIRRMESIISGRGLGFDFEFWIKKLASQFPIEGAVSTRSDGSIKIIAKGEEQDLREFISRLKRGSLLSEIESFHVTWEETGEKIEKFFMLSC
jgi:acylphosphatase